MEDLNDEVALIKLFLVEDVQKRMELCGVTVNELAKHLSPKVSRAAVYGFFAGKNSTLDTVVRILDACQMQWSFHRPSRTMREQWAEDTLPPEVRKAKSEARRAALRMGKPPPK